MERANPLGLPPIHIRVNGAAEVACGAADARHTTSVDAVSRELDMRHIRYQRKHYPGGVCAICCRVAENSVYAPLG